MAVPNRATGGAVYSQVMKPQRLTSFYPARGPARGLFGMLICRNIAAASALGLAIVATGSGAADAQTLEPVEAVETQPPIVVPGDGGATRQRIDPIAQATALPPVAAQAFELVGNWVRRASVPDESITLNARDVAAVQVTVRLHGVLLGRATAAVENPPGLITADAARDITPLLQQATREALDAAGRRLRALAGEAAKTALPGDLETAAPLLSVHVQLASPPQRLGVADRRDLVDRIVPGVHGLAARHDRQWAWIFPAYAISANLSLKDQFMQLLTGVGLGVERIDDLGSADDPALFRFQVIHVARLVADGPPERLHRGGRIVAFTPPSADRLSKLANTWADVLIRRQTQTGAFRAVFEPSPDRYPATLASPAETGLALYALARYRRLDGLHEARADQIDRRLKAGLEQLVKQLGMAGTADAADQPNTGERARLSVGDSAVALLAIIEAPDTAKLKGVRDQLADAIVFAQRDDGAMRSRPHVRAPEAARPVQALASLAMVRAYEQTRDPRYLDAARRLLAYLWPKAENHPESIMPWAAAAELDLMRLDKTAPTIGRLRTALDDLWQRQVDPFSPALATRVDAPGHRSPDAVGGFVLAGVVPAEPTWRSAAVLTAMAIAPRVEGFVPDDRLAAWLIDAMMGVRFLDQLTLGVHDAWYSYHLEHALGGVRLSPWDNRQPTPATAMALLAVSELQHTLTAE